MALMDSVIGFLISLVISGVIIFVATKMFGEKEGYGTAILTALIGAVIYAIVSYFLGAGWIASLIAAIAWLIALGTMYKMGWLKSLIVAFIIWVFATIVSLVLPTVTGPL